MIDNETKEQIRFHLINFCEIAGSDNMAAQKLRVNNSFVSMIRNRKSDGISEKMWRTISKKLAVNFDEQGAYAETTQSAILTDMFNDSRINRVVFGIILNPGGGKTFCLDRARLNSPNVFFVKCVTDMMP